MRVTNIHEAKTHLSKYVELAFEGEEVIICKAGKPMAKLIAYKEDLTPRKPGYWKGKITIAEDFDELPIGPSKNRSTVGVGELTAFFANAPALSQDDINDFEKDIDTIRHSVGELKNKWD